MRGRSSSKTAPPVPVLHPGRRGGYHEPWGQAANTVLKLDHNPYVGDCTEIDAVGRHKGLLGCQHDVWSREPLVRLFQLNRSRT